VAARARGYCLLEPIHPQVPCRDRPRQGFALRVPIKPQLGVSSALSLKEEQLPNEAPKAIQGPRLLIGLGQPGYVRAIQVPTVLVTWMSPPITPASTG
jgi:hypothetical protein